MAILQVNDGPHTVDNLPAHRPILDLNNTSTLEDEIDAMVHTIQAIDMGLPDQMIATCMALMGRCTELHILLVRAEGQYRRAKAFRVNQLAKVMELIDFEYRAASRLIEVRRQEVELSK